MTSISCVSSSSESRHSVSGWASASGPRRKLNINASTVESAAAVVDTAACRLRLERDLIVELGLRLLALRHRAYQHAGLIASLIADRAGVQFNLLADQILAFR